MYNNCEKDNLINYVTNNKVQESINRSILLEFDEAKKNLSKLIDNHD